MGLYTSYDAEGLIKAVDNYGIAVLQSHSLVQQSAYIAGVMHAMSHLGLLEHIPARWFLNPILGESPFFFHHFESLDLETEDREDMPIGKETATGGQDAEQTRQSDGKADQGANGHAGG